MGVFERTFNKWLTSFWWAHWKQNCERTHGIHQKNTCWIIWWVLLKCTQGFVQKVPTGYFGRYFQKELTMYLAGNNRVNCLKTHNKLTMCLPGKAPSAPSEKFYLSNVIPDLDQIPDHVPQTYSVDQNIHHHCQHPPTYSPHKCSQAGPPPLLNTHSDISSLPSTGSTPCKASPSSPTTPSTSSSPSPPSTCPAFLSTDPVFVSRHLTGLWQIGSTPKQVHADCESQAHAIKDNKSSTSHQHANKREQLTKLTASVSRTSWLLEEDMVVCGKKEIDVSVRQQTHFIVSLTWLMWLWLFSLLNTFLSVA